MHEQEGYSTWFVHRYYRHVTLRYVSIKYIPESVEEYVTLTSAGCAITVQCESRVAETVEGILCVHTDVVTPTIVSGTLIHWTYP